MTAIAVIIAFYLNTDVPIGGIPGLRISFHGPFVQFPGILFGPMFGGISAAVRDLVSFLLKTSGIFLWQLTITEFLNGAAIAFLWMKLKNVNFSQKWFSNDYNPFFAVLILLGFVMIILTRDGDVPVLLQGFSVSRLNDVKYGLVIAGLSGLFAVMLFRVSVRFFYKDTPEKDEKLRQIFALLLAVAIPSVITTFVNSIILYNVYAETVSRGFPFYVIMRLVRRFVTIFYDVYILTVLMGVYDKISKQINRKGV
jgi:hypothetical protein